ncbi:hypothetical protein INT44_005498 [Umbelopsis vinacea]|uniref:RCC1/BLIP-II n=1 Tax=Umbelopsis vinacea TaxID=44442 RepID=A0A8H7UPZ9_9FUNG|nr:hypothetical protein INT44_005498 [Umbelopsis vinacea]
MFHATTRTLAPRVRCYATRAQPIRSANALAIGAGLGLLLTAGGIVHNDASNWIPWKKSTPAPQDVAAGHEKQDPNITPTSWDQQNQVNRGLKEPGLFLWGDNTTKIIQSSSSKQSFPYPHQHEFFRGQYLRDVAFGPDHAVTVDYHGNVYQWGVGHSQVEQPNLTLANGDIVQVAASASNVYALSKSGHLYVLPAAASSQEEHADRSLPKELQKSSGSWVSWLMGSSKPVNGQGHAYAVPMEQNMLKSGERITSIATGLHHVLAVTSSGRVLSAPADVKGNERGQLGTGTFDIEAPSEYGYIKWNVVNDTLDGVKVVEAAAGHYHSVVRSEDGRVFTFGANNFGQLGQGDVGVAKGQCNYPLEVRMLYSLSGRASKPPGFACSRIAAGGENSYFVVDKIDKQKRSVTEVYSAGMGQYGQLGNAMYSQLQLTPVKVKEISNNSEYDEKSGKMVPIGIADMVAGATHVFSVLDNVTNVDERTVDTTKPNFGHDVYGWGHNFHSQVGNGKRNNIATPIHPETLMAEQEPHSKDVNSIVVNRLQLAPVTHVKVKVPGSNKEQTARVDQKMVAGVGISTVYSRVLPEK